MLSVFECCCIYVDLVLVYVTYSLLFLFMHFNVQRRELAVSWSIALYKTLKVSVIIIINRRYHLCEPDVKQDQQQQHIINRLNWW